MSAPIRGTREASSTGYEAPFRKSLIDPDELCYCPRYAFLGVTMLCGLLFLSWLPGTWPLRLVISGGLWLVSVVGMIVLTRRDPQWLEVVASAVTEADSLES